MGAGKYDKKHGVGIMLNKKWRQIFIDTEYNERATTVTIVVNRQRVKLMSVYFSHSGYSDHHIEKNLQIDREVHDKLHTYLLLWKLALRIVTSPSERWLMKAAEWNPELSSKYRTNRATGRPRKDGKMTSTNSSNLLRTRQKTLLKAAASTKHINTAKIRGRWTLLEDKYTMTAEERHESNERTRRNTQSRPARYVNGVRLSHEEVDNIT